MPEKILIVDDEHDLAAELAFWLEEQGYETMMANDGIEGFEKLRREKPDLLIMDVLMPGMTGIQVIEEIQRIQHELPVPVLIISARASTRDLLRESPSLRFLTKPFSQDVLLREVRKLLELTGPA